MAEEARLESVCTPKAYRGFESRSLRNILPKTVKAYFTVFFYKIIQIKPKRATRTFISLSIPLKRERPLKTNSFTRTSFLCNLSKSESISASQSVIQIDHALYFIKTIGNNVELGLKQRLASSKHFQVILRAMLHQQFRTPEG